MLISAALSLALIVAVRGQQQVFSSQRLVDRVEAAIDDIVARYRIPGLSVAFVQEDDQGGWTEWQGAYGTATVQGDTVTNETLFGIASNSKLFTYFGIGLLVENGTALPNGDKLIWNTKIKDILPWWELQDKYSESHVTITDLLAHQSGLPRNDHAHSLNDSIENVVRNLRHFRPSYELRQHWQYNNQAYMTLSHIVTVLSGTPFDQYIKAHIFDPLDMTSSFYNAVEARKTGLVADGFWRTGRNLMECKQKWEEERSVTEACLGTSKAFGWWADERIDTLVEAGAGGVITSSSDMIKWLKELVHPDKLPSGLIERASLGYSVPVFAPPPRHSSVITYGLAQQQWTYRGVNIVSHGGYVPGQLSLMIRLPQYKAAVMVMSNDDDFANTMNKIMTYKVLEIVAGLDKDDMEAREFELWLSQVPEEIRLPDDPAPPTDEKQVVGEYHDQGYGSLKLVPLGSYNQRASTSKRYDNLDADTILKALPVKLNATTGVYLAQMDKAFQSHVVFTPYTGNVFNWTALRAVPLIDRHRRPTKEWMLAEDGTGSAVLDGKGIGMFGNWWGAVGDDAVRHADVNMEHAKDKAEVWFDKL